MNFQNCFIAVNLMIDNRFGRAAGVGLGSLLVIPFLFLEHCFHFLLLEHFHFFVFRLFFIFLPHDFFQFLNPLLPALSYSLLRLCPLHVQFLTFVPLTAFYPGLVTFSFLSFFHFVFRGCV